MFNNVKIDGLDHLRCRGQGLGRGILLPSISQFASHFHSSPEKLLKHSTNQFFFSFLDVMLEKLFPTPSEVVSSYSDLPPTPRPEMSSGLEIIREHSHLAEPDIRHILFSTRSLPHFTTCLHSNPRQQDTIRGWSWTSFTEYFVKRSG